LVQLYGGDPAASGMTLSAMPLLTPVPLDSMQAVALLLEMPTPPAGVVDGTLPVFSGVSSPGTLPHCGGPAAVVAGSGVCAAL